MTPRGLCVCNLSSQPQHSMEPSSESSRKFMDMISTLCAEVDNKQKLPEKKPQRNASGKCMKPAYAFSAIIALALKNSPDGRLPVWKIYAFILEHFRYFRTANEAWRNSVRHSLSKNGNFEKCLKEDGSKMKDGNMWQIIESRREAIDREILKYRLSDKYHAMNLAALNKPEILTSLEEGSFGLPPFVFEKEYKQAYRILANQKNKRPEIPKNFEVASNVFKESNMNTLNTDLDTLARPNPISVLLNENTPSPISRIDLLKPSIPSSSSQNMSEASMNAEEKQIYEKYLTSDSNPLLSSAALPGAVVPEIDDCMLWECEQDTLEAGIQTRLRHDENDFWLPTRSNCIFDLPSDNLSVVSDGF
ncbi:hypothetical protein L596_006260 [Steinernema carpocapsae]|uniref:Fork-head domain-containing protein n=1 Tax=Steinernema carpocapsae TaxID=34508 RepID=A0A4U8V1S7_STECR|nr:hypothetical protein L596_006260 [Steinernema carpocapsae]